jgi:peptidoglycan/LPS O-acetylase OafA/YrhL
MFKPRRSQLLSENKDYSKMNNSSSLPALPPTNSVSAQKNNFNFLRLLFASLVILSHAFELKDGDRSREPLSNIFHTISFGDLAVYAFFILSGYLITQSWDRDPDWMRFLVKRAARIFPAFIACSIVCGVVIAPLASNSGQYFSEFNALNFARGVLFLQRPNIPETFQNLHYHLVNGAMWSISYEFLCYLLILGLGLTGAIKSKQRWLLASSAILFVYIYRQTGNDFRLGQIHFALNNPIIFLSILFLAGSAFYLFRKHIPYNILGLMICSIGFIFCMFSKNLVVLGTASFGAYALFSLAFKHSHVFERLRPKTDVSYGVYLYGWPVQQILLEYLPDHHPLLSAILALSICFILGKVSWTLLEKPAMNWAKAF